MSIFSRRCVKYFSGALAMLFALCFSIPEPAFADPPPWAPAHGYREKHKNKHQNKHQNKHRGKHKSSYEEPRDDYDAPDVGIPKGSCNRAALGAILGGAAGGYAGSKIGSGSGKRAATAAGTVIGLIVGGVIGRSMDKLDQACIGQALEQAEIGQRVQWLDPDTQVKYEVTPTRTFKSGTNRHCREYVSGVVFGKLVEKFQGTACRNLDGSWQRLQ
jgi:surface antigen